MSSSLTTLAIFETKSIQETFTIKFAHTQKSFITRSIAVFLINVFVFLFRKNHDRNPPEPAKIWQNRLKNLLKPIVNLTKTVSDTKNDQKERQ